MLAAGLVIGRLTKAPIVLPITSGGNFARTAGFAVSLNSRIVCLSIAPASCRPSIVSWMAANASLRYFLAILENLLKAEPFALKENLSGLWSRRIVAACMGALGDDGLVARSVVIDPVLNE